MPCHFCLFFLRLSSFISILSIPILSTPILIYPYPLVAFSASSQAVDVVLCALLFYYTTKLTTRLDLYNHFLSAGLFVCYTCVELRDVGWDGRCGLITWGEDVDVRVVSSWEAFFFYICICEAVCWVQHGSMEAWKQLEGF